MSTHPDTTALLVIDLQPDFMPGGALPCHEGDAVVPGIAALVAGRAYRTVVATQDWHPPGHASFASSHPGRAPFETIALHGHPQVLWPDHCVQGTPGAALDGGVDWNAADLVLRKGTRPQVDSYSAFRENIGPGGERPPTGLAGWLRERGIDEVHLCGLARLLRAVVGAGRGGRRVPRARAVEPHPAGDARRRCAHARGAGGGRHRAGRLSRAGGRISGTPPCGGR